MVATPSPPITRPCSPTNVARPEQRSRHPVVHRMGWGGVEADRICQPVIQLGRRHLHTYVGAS
eukprot:394820-Prymnesium_polylepis.1